MQKGALHVYLNQEQGIHPFSFSFMMRRYDLSRTVFPDAERCSTSSKDRKMRPIRFIFALHNHQPVGNFDNLFEQSFQESYFPFLQVFSEYPALKLTLHTSGPLMEWLNAHHPEYVDQLAELVEQKRIEILGGPFYEPILAMIPSRDRIGQIRRYSEWIRKRLGADVLGMWTPERVWEQSYVRDLVQAGIRYTILDDFHFRNAGVPDTELSKHYITEDDGKTMFIFPGSEQLRYLIPFRNVEQSLEYFARESELHNEAVLVHADDGEKFGSWPDTYGTVFEERWLHRFFQALSDSADWLITTTPSEVLESIPPKQTIYLPDGSYREMTEWVLSPENQLELSRLNREMLHHENWTSIRRFIRGGFWRNFKVRYAESNEMYARMMYVSTFLEDSLKDFARLRKKLETGAEPETPNEDAIPAPPKDPLSRESIPPNSPLHAAINELECARESLYRGQCNCGYWHGAFGGVYLPHLRNAVYRELINAENALERFRNPERSSWVEAEVDDFDFDAQNEIKIANEHLALWFAPHRGGTLYELDLKSISLNLLAGMSRSSESYHGLIHQAAENECTLDHNGNRIVLKQDGLNRMIQYDPYPRKTLIDLFYDVDADFNDIRFGNARQHGTFLGANYSSLLRKKPGRIQLRMSAEGWAYGTRILIHKGITLNAGSREMEIAYRLENIPLDYRIHFAVEMNFSGLPGNAEDRYFETRGGTRKNGLDSSAQRLGNLSTNLDLYNAANLSLVDEWLKLRVNLSGRRAANIYAFPIESVNQSEGGFELVHQSVCVQPHWIVEPEPDGTWSNEFTIAFESLS